MGKRFARKGDVYLDTIGGTIITVVKADNGMVVFDNGATVKEDAMETYVFQKNDEGFEIPQKDDVSLDDGVLYWRGRPISSGTLKIEKILAPVPGGAIMAVAGKDGTGTDVFRYNVFEDRFTKLFHEAGTIQVLFCDKDVVFLLGREEAAIKVEENEFTSVSERVYLVKDGHLDTVYDAEDGNVGTKAVCAENNDDRVSVVVSGDKAFEEKLDEEGNPFYVETEAGKKVTRQFVITRTRDEDGDEIYASTDMISVKTSLVPTAVKPVHDGRGSVVVVTDDEIVYTNAGYSQRRAVGRDVVKTFKSHPYLVRLEPGTHRNVFVLANEDREIAKIVVTKTQDRGYVTEIE